MAKLEQILPQAYFSVNIFAKKSVRHLFRGEWPPAGHVRATRRLGIGEEGRRLGQPKKIPRAAMIRAYIEGFTGFFLNRVKSKYFCPRVSFIL
jgi:hypothetical protein